MKKAWEYARIKTDSAIPNVLNEEEQSWKGYFEQCNQVDSHLKLIWNSNVPGSAAPESILLAAIQAKENMGYIVKNGVQLWLEGQKAVENNDMVLLNKINTELWYEINNAEIDETHASHSYVKYTSYEQYEKSVSFPSKMEYNKATIEDKMVAGWLGQIVGGALGTMIEGYTTKAITEKFGNVDFYIRTPNTYNDDITYELAFLEAFEEKGNRVTSFDIAKSWIGHVPGGWSAEEIALNNIRWGVIPPQSGKLNNPFGEWIGAQMRGAVCGMVAPGDVKKAAYLAYIDGEISHYNNGIFGEIFNAVLVSNAFVMSDIRKNIEQTICVIPSDSEYYSVVKYALDQCLENENWLQAWENCEEKYYKYNWIHAYPNAAAQVIALYFGEGDFNKTANIIAMCGQDVDCNAAQILCAVAIMNGTKGIDEKWTAPIGDTLNTYLRRDRVMSIKELSKRTVRLAVDNE